jgi:1-deoxy-D-xylulose-5-phosphate synthase
MLNLEKSIKNKKKTFLRNIKMFWFNAIDLARKNEKIIGITPAMPSGSSLKFMMDALPERAFDVGIAEQHAVTLSAGMATGNGCFATSTPLLQGAYDQVIHDVALQNLPVIFFWIEQDSWRRRTTHHGVLTWLICDVFPI